jgi:hypothetical protein
MLRSGMIVFKYLEVQQSRATKMCAAFILNLCRSRLHVDLTPPGLDSRRRRKAVTPSRVLKLMYRYIQLWPPIHACFFSICAPRHGTGQLHWAWVNHVASSLPQHRQPQNGGGTVLAETHDANRLTLCLTFHYFCSPAVFLRLTTAPPTAQELCEAVWLDRCSFWKSSLATVAPMGKPHHACALELNFSQARILQRLVRVILKLILRLEPSPSKSPTHTQLSFPWHSRL